MERRSIYSFFAAPRDSLWPAKPSGIGLIAALGVYLFLWTLYGALAKASQDLHPDMLEEIIWSRHLAAGFLKHPPFSGLLVKLWFAVFPLMDWLFYLLAILVAVIALLTVWELSGDYLDGKRRVLAVALLTLVPFFNFHALKYNANTVLMPLWALTTLCSLRSYRARSLAYGSLAGAAAAAAMLCKYWSIFLMGGLVLAALIDSRRDAYFRSAVPWITIAVGLAVLSPHLIRLADNHFAPIQYAIYVHGDQPITSTLREALRYLIGAAGYVALPVALVIIAARPTVPMLADMIWPADIDRRLAALAFWGPLLLPAAIAPVTGIALDPLWSMSAWSLLPILLLSPPQVAIEDKQRWRILAFASSLPVVMVLLAPAIALVIHYFGVLPVSAYSRLIGAQTEQAWHDVTREPLRYVDGDLAYGVAVYAPEQPRVLPDLPPIPGATLTRYGRAMACYYDDLKCMGEADLLQRNEPMSRRFDMSLTPTFLGVPGPPRRYMLLVVPPHSE
jgi:4-amino-4-deoxy-L-arabinose transferase-like glycosyltransferase